MRTWQVQCSCGRFRNVEQEDEPEGCDSCKDGTQYVKLLYESCPKCGGDMARSNYCGVMVCENENCGYHKGLARCYCGWSEGGGDGRQELVEAGETIEEEE